VISGLGFPANPASNLARCPSLMRLSLISRMNFGACSVAARKENEYAN